ncbi:MAG: hypothetical protein EBQ96_04600 [Proteobacteria bacterium]|nr:hypothetical protein [Pseudomonadota bacterium]
MSNIEPIARSYPLPAPPDTWGADAAFCKLLDDYRARWRKKGYEFVWGLEINFELKAFALGVDRDFDDTKLTREHIWRYYGLARNDFEMVSKIVSDAEIASTRDRLARVIYETILDGTIPDDYFKEVRLSRAEVADEVKGFFGDGNLGDDNAHSHSVRSLCLAHLHLLLAKDGGLRDIIEPRFGNFESGIGWFDDNGDDCEVRLLPHHDPYEFERRYHTAIQNIGNTSVLHGASMIPNYNHFHFSLLEADTGINVMESNEPRHIELRRMMMQGLAFFMATYPGLFHDYDLAEPSRIFSISANTDRNRSIRQKPKSWELRSYKGSELLHLTRDMAIVMMAAYCGPYLMEKDKDRLLSVIPLETHLKPVIEGNETQAVSGIKSLLEHSTIQPNGSLVADDYVASWNTKLLLRECGIDPESASITFGDKTYDLTTYGGWVELSRLMHVDLENGVIKAPEGLPEDIAEAFTQYRVIGTRTAFSTALRNTDLGFKVFERATDALNDDGILEKMIQPETRKALAAHYAGHEKDKARQIAAKVMYSVGECLQQAPDKVDTMYGLIWEQVVSPTVLQFVAETMSIQRRNNWRGRVLKREELTARRSLIKTLRQVFGEAVDAEIAYRRAMGQASNQMIAGLEDARQDIGDFLRRPRALMQPAFDGTAVYMMEAIKDQPDGACERMLHYHRSYITSAFLLMMTDESIPYADIRKTLDETREWVAESLARAEAEYPDKAQSPQYIANRRRLEWAQEQAIKTVKGIMAAFEKGKPATLKYDFFNR